MHWPLPRGEVTHWGDGGYDKGPASEDEDPLVPPPTPLTGSPFFILSHSPRSININVPFGRPSWPASIRQSDMVASFALPPTVPLAGASIMIYESHHTPTSYTHHTTPQVQLVDQGDTAGDSALSNINVFPISSVQAGPPRLSSCHLALVS